jgi:hypothetical protein
VAFGAIQRVQSAGQQTRIAFEQDKRALLRLQYPLPAVFENSQSALTHGLGLLDIGHLRSQVLRGRLLEAGRFGELAKPCLGFSLRARLATPARAWRQTRRFVSAVSVDRRGGPSTFHCFAVLPALAFRTQLCSKGYLSARSGA